jgi:hypothetical protein
VTVATRVTGYIKRVRPDISFAQYGLPAGVTRDQWTIQTLPFCINCNLTGMFDPDAHSEDSKSASGSLGSELTTLHSVFDNIDELPYCTGTVPLNADSSVLFYKSGDSTAG